jgi:hypothetical protein
MLIEVHPVTTGRLFIGGRRGCRRKGMRKKDLETLLMMARVERLSPVLERLDGGEVGDR